MAAYRGFLTARAGELMLAREHFAAAWELWRRLQEGFCQTCLVGLIEGYEAYLEYRLSDRSEAARRLERALDSSLLLEVRYGLTLFELHRMQLGHNLARIDWRFGFLEEAFALTGAMVGYLQGLRRDLPFHRDWRPSRMLSCPVYLRQAMMVQIAGEAIERLVARPETAHWETFLNEAMIDDDESGSRFFVDPRLWRWLLARRARLEGDRRRYLQTLEEILPAGPRGLGTSYYSILVDFADFCSAEPSIAARKVVDFLARDAAKWKNFPAPLARRLSEIRDAPPLRRRSWPRRAAPTSGSSPDTWQSPGRAGRLSSRGCCASPPAGDPPLTPPAEPVHSAHHETKMAVSLWVRYAPSCSPKSRTRG